MAIEQELPQDLLMEILSRLPVKSLLRLKSVSKYWFSLIQNPSFIHLHHNCSKKKDCLVVMRHRNDCDGNLILSSVPDKTPTHDLFESFEGLNLKDVNLIASSNGLFFLAHFYKPKFVICNPATKEFRILPDPFHHARHTSHLGFVFDPNTKDYKVVRVATLYESDLTPYDAYDSPYVASDKDLLQEIPIDEKVHRYDLSTDCWRKVDAGVPKYLPSVSSYHFRNSLNGVFYWLYPCDYPMIIGFRVLDELFEEMPMLDISWLDCFPCTLCTMNDSLALVVQMCRIEPAEEFFDFWEKKEEDMSSSNWLLKGLDNLCSGTLKF
ncbi:hypothetical protein Acr_00g0012160 [Actinidia rufa]|uniref:F-box domain-containing protein n=1 Tax=Actinidia rufa TaxID=165716 RepID=A0A7J0D9N9_9ERIC|nr:hypothetical protein Acr_00g0012160 [Actinidia rufa]